MNKSSKLRINAEKKLKCMDPEVRKLPDIELRTLVHELEVHQIELRMQNEELHKIQAELEAARKKYFDLYNFAPCGYLTLNEKGVIIESNLTAAELLGVERNRLLDKSFYDFVDKNERDTFYLHLRRLFENKTRERCELRVSTSVEKMVVQLESIVNVNEAGQNECRTILTDITEHKLLEERLIQSNKMESVGVMAGGIAHNFNNIIQAIVGNATILKMDMMEEDPLLSNVKGILASAKKAAALTKSILSFSRVQAISLRPVEINELIKQDGNFLESAIREDIGLKLFLANEPLTVMADSLQIEQVLINLAANARDAMPDGGTFEIRTERIMMDDGFIKRRGYGRPGLYALISVSDTGAGVDEQTIKRLFEPFFTTKEVGKGTGLGLSTAYRIAEQHNGYIEAISEIGKGTTFKIYLPLTEASIQEEKTAEIELSAIKGNETLLLAEDDEEIRTLTKEILERFGYKVLTAVDGEDAIKIFNENKGEIGLMLLDMIMPKKNGREVYNEINNIAPHIEVIFMSGYAAGAITKEDLLGKGINFIPKPSFPRDILAKVREVLDKNPVSKA